MFFGKAMWLQIVLHGWVVVVVIRFGSHRQIFRFLLRDFYALIEVGCHTYDRFKCFFFFFGTFEEVCLMRGESFYRVTRLGILVYSIRCF